MIGTATFPWEKRHGESDITHGVAVHYKTLPGGEMETLNLGDNAVHEVMLLVLKRCYLDVIIELHMK